MTTIGDLNHKITIQSATLASDSMGGYTKTWATVDSVWSKKTQHRSNEAVQAMSNTGVSVYNYRIRYRSDVTTSSRILDGTTYLNIIGVSEVNENIGGHFLDLTAEAT